MPKNRITSFCLTVLLDDNFLNNFRLFLGCLAIIQEKTTLAFPSVGQSHACPCYHLPMAMTVICLDFTKKTALNNNSGSIFMEELIHVTNSHGHKMQFDFA